VVERAASALDWLAMAALGSRLQRATWREIVEGMAEESGGTAPDGVQEEDATLDGGEAERAEAWLRTLAEERRRHEHETQLNGADDARDASTPRG
jgi:hypothetical protein